MTIAENLAIALKIGGFGMIGIFVFMLFFWGVLTLLFKLFPEKEEE